MRYMLLMLLAGCTTPPVQPAPVPSTAQVAQTTPIMTPSPSPPAPSATPSPVASVVPAPLDAPPTFGAIQALRTVQGEQQRIGIDGGNPLNQDAGRATSRYLTVDGLEYAVHWDEAAKFAALKVGDTVTIYPTHDSVCFSLEDCRRLVYIFPSDHFLPPLDLVP